MQEPLGGIHVYILRLLHRLGIIRVPTEYRESGHGKCLYTYLYNITYNASLICAFNMFTHHVIHSRHKKVISVKNYEGLCATQINLSCQHIFKAIIISDVSKTREIEDERTTKRNF